MEKRFLSILLCICMMLSLLPMSAWAADITPSKPAEGDGSSDSPYQITSEAELYWFAGLVNGTLTDGTTQKTDACAELTSDITINTQVLEDGSLVSDTSGLTVWTPIGGNTTNQYGSGMDSYSGVFDGGNHTVSGLYYNDGGHYYVGFFGSCQNATVKNLKLADSYVYGWQNTGGICGGSSGSTISNCLNGAAVSANSYVGGVCGRNSSTIEKCANTGSVSANETYSENYCGGICGYNTNGIISNCWNAGAVNTSKSGGGICGTNKNNGSITGCYNYGAMSNNTLCGAVVGVNSSTDTTLSNCYYDTDTSELNGSSFATGKTTAEFVSGEVCYLLNNGVSDGTQVWYQNIDIGTPDTYPQFSGGRVIQSGYTYTNADLTVVRISFKDYAPGKVYDGAALANPTEAQLTLENTSYGNVTFTWYKDSIDNDHKLEGAPNGVGTYYVVAYVEETETTSAVVATSDAITVSKAAAAITGVSVTDRTYNGSAITPAGTAICKVGELDITSGCGTLVYTYTGTGSTSYADSSIAPTNAGTYKLVVSVADDNVNYTGASDVINFTIEPKQLTVTGLTAASRAYDGTTAVTLTGGTLSGKVGSDDVTVIMPASGTLTEAGVGTGKMVTVTKPELSGSSAANYTLADISGITVDITPAQITITGDGTVAVTKPYDGTSAAGDLTGAPAFSGKIGSEDVSVTAIPGTYAADSLDVGTGKTVTLTLALDGTAADNYALANDDYTFTGAVITKGTYGTSVSANVSALVNITTTDTVTLSVFTLPAGFRNAAIVSVTEMEDTDSILTISGDGYTIVPTAISQSAACNVIISSDNYENVTATLTFTAINKNEATITASIADKTYDGTVVSVTPTSEVSDLTYSYQWQKNTGSADTAIWETMSPNAAPRDAGSYQVIITGESDTHIGTKTVTFTIDKATVTATADNKSMIAGGTLPNFTVSYTGIADSDTAESIFTTPAIASCEADGNTEGSYPISVTMPVLTEAAAINYTVATPVSGTLTVNNDTTAPEVSFGTDGNETWSALAASTVTVTDTESGVDPASLKYAWSTDTAAPSSGWASFTSGDTLTKSGSDGDWYLHIQAADTFGNVTNTVSGRFRLDNTASTVILISPQGTNVPVSVSDIVLGFSEGVSGVENKKVTVSDGTDMYIYTIGESDNNISVTDSVYRAAIPVEWFVKDTEPLILEYNTEYTVGLESEAYIDAAGNGLDSGDIGSFKTEKESYTVTFKDWDETVLSTQTVIDGSKATSPANPVRAGYSFAGWYVDKAYTALFDFNTAITADQTVYAKWTKVDSDNGDSDDENSDRKDSGGRASNTVPVPSVTPRTSETAEASLPKAAIEAARSSMNVLSLTTPIASISFDVQTLDSIEEQTASEVTFSAGRVDPETLGEDARKLVGDRPVYDFSITSGGRTISQFGGKATVSIPYKPTAEELRNPEYITVWYIDGSGNVVPVPSGRYDASTGTVSFTATHFSRYAVAYVQKSFGDLEDTAWAKKQIEVLASKGIMEGRTVEAFAPQAGITRAEYIAALVKTLGVTAKADTNFNDVAEGSRYYEEIAIAKKLGISNGSGNNCFRPEDTITRQDMLVLTERALRSLGKISSIGALADLERFTDRAEVKDYAAASIAALVKEGLIEGSSGKLNVKSDTTRAEAAVFLYRLYNR